MNCSICDAVCFAMVNGIPTCDDHIVPVLDLVVETESMEKGIDSDVIKQALWEALQESGDDD